MRRTQFRILIISVILGLSSGSVLPKPVGRFAVIQNDVKSLKPGSSEAVAALPGAAIELLEQETTGAGSAAKMTFGEGAVISIGQKTTFAVTQQTVDEATGADVSTMDLALGKVRVFVSRFWGGRPEVRVNTPSAVAGIKGSEVVVESLSNGVTRVTVLSGSAWVAARGATGVRQEVGPGQQIRVGPGASGLGTPVTVSMTTQSKLWEETEPAPSIAKTLPDERPIQEPIVVTLPASVLPTWAATGPTPTSNPTQTTVPDPLPGPPICELGIPGTDPTLCPGVLPPQPGAGIQLRSCAQDASVQCSTDQECEILPGVCSAAPNVSCFTDIECSLSSAGSCIPRFVGPCVTR